MISHLYYSCVISVTLLVRVDHSSVLYVTIVWKGIAMDWTVHQSRMVMDNEMIVIDRRITDHVGRSESNVQNWFLGHIRQFSSSIIIHRRSHILSRR